MTVIEAGRLSDHDRENIDAILGGEGDWFSCRLLRLIARSEINNRLRFRLGWPEHVNAVEDCLYLPSTRLMAITQAMPAPQWRCEACGRPRADTSLDVYSHDFSAIFGLSPGTATRNVSYCIDSPSCRARAVEIADAFVANIRKDMDA